MKSLETKTFPLNVILTVTTGRLLTTRSGPNDNGISALYEILEWICGEAPYTHALGRFAEEAKPYLYQCFPELACAEASLVSLDRWVAADKTERKTECAKMWFAELHMLFPAIQKEYAIAPMDPDRHTSKHPVDELLEMGVAPEKIVVAQL